MSLESTIAAGNVALGRTLTDRCTITRRLRGAFDPATGTYDAGTSTRYTGPCRVRQALPQAVDVGETELNLTRPELVLPRSAVVDDIAEGDTVVVIASLAPQLVGQSFRISAELSSGTTIGRRFQLEAVQE